jgi:hypothetical protein
MSLHEVDRDIHHLLRTLAIVRGSVTETTRQTGQKHPKGQSGTSAFALREKRKLWTENNMTHERGRKKKLSMREELNHGKHLLLYGQTM